MKLDRRTFIKYLTFGMVSGAVVVKAVEATVPEYKKPFPISPSPYSGSPLGKTHGILILDDFKDMVINTQVCPKCGELGNDGHIWRTENSIWHKGFICEEPKCYKDRGFKWIRWERLESEIHEEATMLMELHYGYFQSQIDLQLLVDKYPGSMFSTKDGSFVYDGNKWEKE